MPETPERAEVEELLVELLDRLGELIELEEE